MQQQTQPSKPHGSGVVKPCLPRRAVIARYEQAQAMAPAPLSIGWRRHRLPWQLIAALAAMFVAGAIFTVLIS